MQDWMSCAKHTFAMVKNQEQTWLWSEVGSVIYERVGTKRKMILVGDKENSFCELFPNLYHTLSESSQDYEIYVYTI